MQEVDRIANTNLMPSYLTRQQFVADSIRAFEWFKLTRDSSYIDKYIFNDWNESSPEYFRELKKQFPLPVRKEKKTTDLAITDDKNLRKKNQLISIHDRT